MDKITLMVDNFSPCRLGYLVQENARRYPDNLFWSDLQTQERLTYKELFFYMHLAVRRLKERRFKFGQVVSFTLVKSRFFFPLLLACIELGLVLVPIEEDANEVKNTVSALHPKLLLYESDFPLDREAFPAHIEVVPVEDFMAIEAGDIIDDINKVFCDANFCFDLRDLPALLIKTSGTTGESKFVELSEKNLSWNCFGLQKRFKLNSNDRLLCTLPWSHMNAIMITGCLPLVAGAETLYNSVTSSTDPIVEIIKSNPTIASLTPTLLAFLLKHQKEGQSLSDLRFVFCGAAHLSADLWQEAETQLKCKIYQGYGLSETTCWITASTFGQECNYSNVGTPLVGKLRIDKEHDIQIVTELESKLDSPLEIGEIQYKGPILMCGYRFFDGKRSLKLSDEGYFSTGDIGYIDNVGNLKVIGRVKEIIIRSGINVIPESIDSVVRTYPEIAESKTVGIVDRLLGEQIITAFVLKPGATVKGIDIRRFVSDKLPKHFIPNKFVQVARIPRNRVGKVALKKLRSLVDGEYSRTAFEAINTWKYKRAHPLEPEKIVKSFQSKITMLEPIRFIAYWGVGTKYNPTEVERKALQRFKELLKSVRVDNEIDSQLLLLLTDVHAVLNGKPQERIDNYLTEIELLCAEFGFSTMRTSEIWKRHGLSPESVIREAEEVALSDLVESLSISADVIEKLTSSACKHVEKGEKDEGLKRYLIACAKERIFFARDFEGAVFLTYNDNEMNFLTPPLPTFPMSSYQKGIAEKPWFSTK